MSARLVRGGGFLSPRVCGAFLWCVLSLGGLVRADDDTPALPVQKQVDSALHSVLLIAGVLVVLILVAVAIIVYRKAFSATASEPLALPADPLAAAAGEERRGNFSAAAERYEAGGEKLKAAECWEKFKDFARAAECWEAGGELERAAQLHVRSGSALRAAGIYMRTNNYIEAAKIFRNKGDHLRAAQALELFGNKLAAAREYTAAGNHGYAARLLEQERLYAEAAEACQPLLNGQAITAANADRFNAYARLLGLAGERDRAIAVYRRALEALPDDPRARSGLQDLELRTPGERPNEPVAPRRRAPVAVPIAGEGAAESGDLDPEILESGELQPAPSPEELARLSETAAALDGGDPLHRVFTLRSMIHAGRMEPRYSMRLWVQIMRALAERHRADAVLGCLSPDSIVIDMENNVRIDQAAACSPVYRSPEIRAGLPPDRQADIYSMGVILFELVGGTLEKFGAKRAGELFSDVPPWLDELIERCTEKDLTRRYRTTEEVSAALLKLKTAP